MGLGLGEPVLESEVYSHRRLHRLKPSHTKCHSGTSAGALGKGSEIMAWSLELRVSADTCRVESAACRNRSVPIGSIVAPFWDYLTRSEI